MTERKALAMKQGPLQEMAYGEVPHDHSIKVEQKSMQLVWVPLNLSDWSLVDGKTEKVDFSLNIKFLKSNMRLMMQ